MSRWKPWDVGSLPPRDATIEYKRGMDGEIHTCNVADVPPWWNVHNVYWRLLERTMSEPDYTIPLPDDDTDFTPDLARGIVAKYQAAIRDLQERIEAARTLGIRLIKRAEAAERQRDEAIEQFRICQEHTRMAEATAAAHRDKLDKWLGEAVEVLRAVQHHPMNLEVRAFLSTLPGGQQS